MLNPKVELVSTFTDTIHFQKFRDSVFLVVTNNCVVFSKGRDRDNFMSLNSDGEVSYGGNADKDVMLQQIRDDFIQYKQSFLGIHTQKIINIFTK